MTADYTALVKRHARRMLDEMGLRVKSPTMLEIAERHIAAATEDLTERLEQSEKSLEDICEESVRRLKRASDLTERLERAEMALKDVLYDWDQGAFITRVALGKARAALDKTEPRHGK